jgi:hypothetical protein
MRENISYKKERNERRSAGAGVWGLLFVKYVKTHLTLFDFPFMSRKFSTLYVFGIILLILNFKALTD